MTYKKRVTLPSREGNVVVNLDDGILADRLRQYGANANNVSLLTLGWCSLLSDSPIDLKPQKVIRRFAASLCHDLFGVIKDYSRLGHQLTRSASWGSDGKIILTFVDGMKKTPVFPEYLHFVRTRDLKTLTFLLSFLNFGKKLYYEDKELDSAALRGWLDVESRLGCVNLGKGLLYNLKSIVTYLVEKFDDSTFLPNHGSGAVSEKGIRGSEMKNLCFTYDKLIDYLYERGRSSLTIDGAHVPYDNGYVNDTSYPDYRGKWRMPTSKNISRLRFVPKDFAKTRSICMEPLVKQWAQQGVRLWLEKAISDGFLKNYVVLKDQSVNQEACVLGSFIGTLDTLDLSSASDSVLWTLVKGVFPSKVLKHLLATRSGKVKLPDGRLVQPHKYAPMGSALCFPTQCIIYSAVVILAGCSKKFGFEPGVAQQYLRSNTKDMVDNVFHRSAVQTRTCDRLQPFFVYGDDIIVDHMITSDVIDLLVSLGFEVNVQKSFMDDSCFRESCGAWAFAGHRVDPFFFKVKKISSKVTMDSLAGIIEHANKALSYGYDNLRRCLVQFALHCAIEGFNGKGDLNPILFVEVGSDEAFAIASTRPTNRHLEYVNWRYDSKPYSSAALLQRDEWRSIAARPREGRELSVSYDNQRHIAWWRSKWNGDGNPLDILTDPQTTETEGLEVCWRYTPVFA